MTAAQILESVQDGQRVDFASSLDGGRVANPIIAAQRTRGRGVRIAFTDSSAITMTTGHMLPVVTEDRFFNDGAPGRPRGTWGENWIHAKFATPGTVLTDGKVVASNTPVGQIDAVRLWTYFPAPLPADACLVGSRWHEVLAGWFRYEVDDGDSDDDDWHDQAASITDVTQFNWATPFREQPGRAHSWIRQDSHQFKAYQTSPLHHTMDRERAQEMERALRARDNEKRVDPYTGQTMPWWYETQYQILGRQSAQEHLEASARNGVLYTHAFEGSRPRMDALFFEPLRLPFMVSMTGGGHERRGAPIVASEDFTPLRLAIAA